MPCSAVCAAGASQPVYQAQHPASVAFEEAFKGDELLASRTKRLPGLIKAELEAMGVTEDDVRATFSGCPRSPRIHQGSGAKGRGRGSQTSSSSLWRRTRSAPWRLSFGNLSPRRVRLAQGQDREYHQGVGEPVCPFRWTVAMFGRMTTSTPSRSWRRRCRWPTPLHQRAGARVRLLHRGGRSLGRIRRRHDRRHRFNSSTYYKYVNLHWGAVGQPGAATSNSCGGRWWPCCRRRRRPAQRQADTFAAQICTISSW
jgi:hypothetical protein